MSAGASGGRWRIRLRGALVGAVLGMLGSAAMGSCAPDRVDLRGSWGQARFAVEIADTVAERSRGLMHRAEIPRGAGMLFVYDRPQSVSFWMRNTLIPLDIVFMDATGTVTRVHANAAPLDETPIPGGRNVQYVLEINGGLAAALGIGAGTELRHPAIGTAAAWPCE